MGRAKTPGIYPSADGSWQIDAWYKKRRIRSRGFPSFGEAESYLIEQKAALRRVLVMGERPRITLDAAAAHYVEEEAKRGKISLATEIALLKPVIAHCGHLLLDQIGNQTLQPFVDERLRAGRKTKTINNALSLVRRICNLAAREWRLENGRTWLETAPLIRMLDQSDQRPPHPISWVQQRKLLPCLPPHLGKMVLFSLNTGARESVVCQLRWEWERRITIRKGVTVSVFVVPRRWVKGRKRERILVCNSVAQSIIDSQRGIHEERVFTYHKQVKPGSDTIPTHKAVSSMNNTAWQRARQEAGLGDLHVHDLRHTAGMRLREAGVAERTQDEILWHSAGKTMTTHYASAQLAELHDALEGIRRPSGRESINLLEIARKGAPVPQKSPSVSGERKTA